MAVDNLTSEQRLKAMRANRGRTKPELALARQLWHLGLRYLTAEGYTKRHGVSLIGKPDLVFTKRRVVVFVDGCFWHSCQTCRKAPPTMAPFWLEKLERTKTRDADVTQTLEADGWKVLRVWEHDLRPKSTLVKTALRIAENIKAR